MTSHFIEIMEEQNRNSYSAKYLCKLLVEYRKPVAIILAAAALLAIIFSAPYFITPLYKSTVVIYPTSSNSISKVLISTTYQSEKDIMNFGEDEQTEQMLQVLNSNRVRDKVISRFNLMEHYQIKQDSKYPITKLNKLYDARIKFRRTEYNAVKITVLDSDPVMAAQMANDIAEIFDSTMNQMQKEVAVKAFRLVEEEYMTLWNEMHQLEDSLNTLRKLGVFDYESQVEMLSQQQRPPATLVGQVEIRRSQDGCHAGHPAQVCGHIGLPSRAQELSRALDYCGSHRFKHLPAAYLLHYHLRPLEGLFSKRGRNGSGR